MRKLNFLVGLIAFVLLMGSVLVAVHLLIALLGEKLFCILFVGVLFSGFFFFLARELFEDVGDEIIGFIKERCNGKKGK